MPVTVRRAALISDVHGNALALRAVLDHLATKGVAAVYCLGDIATLGPAPRECIALVREHCDVLVRGNHEDYLLQADLEDDHLGAPIVRAAVEWCRDQVTAEDRAFLASSVPTYELRLGAGHRLVLYHGSPRSNTEDLLATTPGDQLDQALRDHDATAFAGGHTHVQMLRQHRGRWVINAGSVGQPFKEYVNLKAPTVMPFAEYAIVEAKGDDLNVALHRVALDRTELTEQARAWGHPFGDALADNYARAFGGPE